VDGETGLLLGTRTPQTVAEAVATLLSDPARARAMGEKGRERARERFSVEAMVDAMTRLYESFARRR
jgi:glycosyltransferase involved in cell wall biosynthesis